MRRFSIAICLFALAFAFLIDADSAFAQKGARIRRLQQRQQRLEANEGQEVRPRNQKVNPKFNRRTLGDIDPDQRPIFNPRIAALQKARPRLIMEALNLTPAQQLRVQEIRRTHGDEAVGVGRRLRQARQALDRALMSEVYNEVVVKEYTDELIAAQGEQIKINARMRAEIRKTLTPEQVRRFIEKDKEIQRQIRQIKEEEVFNEPNRSPDQQKPPQEEEMDMLDLFR